jgi:hypothetical protein
MATAERCPICHRPRPRGALRCACNYTFEYVSRPRSAPRRSPSLDATLGTLAAGAAIAGYACIPGDPDHAGAGALLLVAGLFAAFASIANISWFFASARARLVTLVLGRTGARVLYVLLGGGLVGAGARLLLAV